MGSKQGTDDRVQIENIESRVRGLRDEMRGTIGRVEDRQAKAMLETGAEVLGGLRQAFVDYAEGAEEAWQR
ncbi:MAG TPA: hypothetical protein VMF07_20765 [Solirubrobacteraceae bacterium]|nr:hypothetical protein [Solirubrobacteraceae bacterium]